MNNRQIKNLFSPIAGLFPLEKRIPFNGHRLIFPFWHTVSDVPPLHLSQLYRVSTIKEFERNLDFFSLNYKPATIEEVSKLSAHKGKTDEKYFFPTFDDGLAECYHVIAPILKKKGIHAAFFINPEFVGNKSLFHRHKASLLLNRLKSHPLKPNERNVINQILSKNTTIVSIDQFLKHAVFTDHKLLDQMAAILEIDFNNYLKQQQPYMNLAQILELQRDGFMIGAHSMDHREFFLSSEDEILSQVSSSIEFVDEQIAPSSKWFAFPFTDFKVPDSVFEKANQLNIWDLSFGTAGIKDDTMPNHLQRIPMETSKFTDGKRLIRTEYVSYFLKTLLGKNKVRRQ
jgi:peptidoglycan/xylan/chitin deacetylase (PgdA/CDA1 family)